MSGTEPQWLIWAREIQGVAQTGLAFSKDPYDLERYHALRDLSVRIVREHTGVDPVRIADLFASDTGYASPKLGVRAGVFDADGRILMVRETSDGGWTLPGGWGEVNQTPAESVVREVFEESGYRVRPIKVAAVWDRSRQGHPASPVSVAKVMFVCALEGGTPTPSLETSEIAWFAEADVPSDLSLRRTLPHQIARMFAHWRDPSLPTEFE